jgi:hypothetical protein
LDQLEDRLNFQHAAGWKHCDTAGLETCATPTPDAHTPSGLNEPKHQPILIHPLALRFGGFNGIVGLQ